MRVEGLRGPPAIVKTLTFTLSQMQRLGRALSREAPRSVLYLKKDLWLLESELIGQVW